MQPPQDPPKPTSIFSSMSCLAWSICWGEPRMMKSLKLGSPLGGSCREISTKAPVCWFMAFTFSPPAGPQQVMGGPPGGRPGRGLRGPSVETPPTHHGR